MLACIWGHAAAPVLARARADSAVVLDDHLPAEQAALAMLEQLWEDAWGVPFDERSSIRLTGSAPLFGVEVVAPAGLGGLALAGSVATGSFEAVASTELGTVDHGDHLIVAQAVAGTLLGDQGLPHADDQAAAGIPLFAVVLEIRAPDGSILVSLLAPMSRAGDLDEAIVSAAEYTALVAGSPQPGQRERCREAHETDVFACYLMAHVCGLGCALLVPTPPAFAGCLGMCGAELSICLATAWFQYARCHTG